MEKSSRADGILLGYYTDSACTQPFYAENPVTGDMNVYAKYEAMGPQETLNFTSFAQMDQGSDISFEISGSGDPAQAVTLEVMDGSDPVELKFTGSNGNYTVSAVNGFNEGCSYQLHLADGWTFIGWFTAAEGGKQITAESICNLTEDQTLHAQWRELVEIPKTVFAFGDMEIYVYEKDTGCEVEYTFVPDEGASYTANDFVFKFMRQGDSEYVDAPINAGAYNVTVSRPADNVYAKFEETYEAVVYINKATRDAGAVSLTQVGVGFTYVELELTDGDGGIYDLSENAVVTFHVVDADGNTRSSAPGSNVVRRLKRGDVQYAYVTVEDPNYRKWTSEHNTTDTIALKSAPYVPIEGYGDFSWYNETDTVFTLTTAEQMLALAYQINSGADSFGGKTIQLGNDIDLSDSQWRPMGTKSNPFRGTFDGQGYTISGLYVDTNGSYAGLFGYTSYYSYTYLDDSGIVITPVTCHKNSQCNHSEPDPR